VVVGRQVLHSGVNESVSCNARCAAPDFADTDERPAAKLRAVRCSCAT
jgi:Protein of unknown function (DUF2563)